MDRWLHLPSGRCVFLEADSTLPLGWLREVGRSGRARVCSLGGLPQTRRAVLFSHGDIHTEAAFMTTDCAGHSKRSPHCLPWGEEPYPHALPRKPGPQCDAQSLLGTGSLRVFKSVMAFGRGPFVVNSCPYTKRPEGKLAPVLPCEDAARRQLCVSPEAGLNLDPSRAGALTPGFQPPDPGEVGSWGLSPGSTILCYNSQSRQK